MRGGVLFLACDRPLTWMYTLKAVKKSVENLEDVEILVVDNSKTFNCFCKYLAEKSGFSYLRVEHDESKEKVERIRETVRLGVEELKRRGCRFLIQIDDDILIPRMLISEFFRQLKQNSLVKCLLVMEDGRVIGYGEEVAGVTGIDLEKIPYPFVSGCPVHFHDKKFKYTLVEIHTFHLDSLEEALREVYSKGYLFKRVFSIGE